MNNWDYIGVSAIYSILLTVFMWVVGSPLNLLELAIVLVQTFILIYISFTSHIRLKLLLNYLRTRNDTSGVN